MGVSLVSYSMGGVLAVDGKWNDMIH
jgi:hypothetical protein